MQQIKSNLNGWENTNDFNLSLYCFYELQKLPQEATQLSQIVSMK